MSTDPDDTAENSPDELNINGLTVSVPGLSGRAPIEGELIDEADLEAASVGEAIDEEVPAFVQRLLDNGMISSDIDVAEIAATDGPTYQLSELSEEEIDLVLGRVETDGIRAAVDMAGQLIVHYNDEKKIEAFFDQIWDEEDDEQPLVASSDTDEGGVSSESSQSNMVTSASGAAAGTGPRREHLGDEIEQRAAEMAAKRAENPLVATSGVNGALIGGVVALVVVIIVVILLAT
jgi:hypothetical protein